MAERRLQVPWGPSDAGGPLGANINHDKQSKNYPAKVARTLPLKKKVHRHYGKALDQNSIGDGVGACVGFTGAHYLNCKPHRPVGRKLFKNEDGFEFYSETTKIDPFDGTWHYPEMVGEDTGTDALSLCKHLQSIGLVSRYEWAFGLDHTLQALLLSPVMLGINWHTGFDSPNRNGYVELEGGFRGRHEVLLVGLDPQLGLVKALNSWSPLWGLKGYFYFSIKNLGTLLDRQGDVVIPKLG